MAYRKVSLSEIASARDKRDKSETYEEDRALRRSAANRFRRDGKVTVGSLAADRAERENTRRAQLQRAAERYETESNKLVTQAKDARESAYSNYDDQTFSEYKKAYDDYRMGLGKDAYYARRYYEEYGTPEEYNAYMRMMTNDQFLRGYSQELAESGNLETNRANVQYEQALTYDIAAAKAERDRLIAEDKEYANTQYQGVSDMGFVPTYKNEDRIAQLNSEISNAQKVQDDARRQTELASVNLDELQAEIDSLSEAQEAAREDYRLWQLETNSIDIARERNMEEADQHLADLRRDYREASKIQDDIYYTSLPEAEDFDELSQEDDRNPLAYRDRLKEATVSEVDTTEAESALTENERAQLEYMRQYAELAGVDHITEDERKVFNYLYNTKGLGEAIKYLDYLDATVQQRRGQALADTVAKNGDVGMYAMMPVVAGADNLGRSTQQIAELMGGDTSGVDVSAYAYANEAMKENAGPIYALYSDVVSNLVSNSPAYVMGGYGQIFSKLAGISGWLSSGILGTSAAGGGIADALNNGYTIDEAITYGLITGISETLMEKALGSLGGGKLPDMMENGIRNVGAYFAKGATGKTASKVVNAFTWLGRTASAGAGEFVEEYLQEVLDPVFRNATLGENNDVNLFSEEALYSGLVGAISGGMMSIAGTGADDAAGRRYVTELQNIAAKDNIDISTNGVARFVADAAIKTGNDTLVEMGEKVIAQIDKGIPVSYMDIGALERLVPNLYLTGSLEGYAISKKDAEKAVAAAEQTHEDYLDGKEVEGGVDATIDAVNAEMNGTERIVPSRISATDEELGLTEETSEVDKSLVTGRNNATLQTGDGSTQVEVVGIGETAGGEFSVRLSDGRVVDASRITMNDSTLHDVIQTAGRSTSKESAEFKFKGMKAQIALYGTIGRGDSVYDSAVRFGRKADFAADASDAEVEAYAREQASVFLQASGTEGIAKDLVYYGILDGAMQKVADLNENHADLSKIARDATTKKGIEAYEKAAKERKINNNRSMFGHKVGDDVDEGVVFEGTANTRRISRKDKAIIEVINEQAIEFGKKVIIHDVIISNGKEVEGVWKMDDGIHISLSNMGGAIKELEDFHAFVGLSIFDHEAFHEIKAKAPDIAKAAIEFTREQYSEEEWNELVEEKTALYRAYGQRLSREGIEEEITADHFTYFMMQRTNLQAIAEKYFTQAELAVGEFDRLMAITLGVWDNQKNISPEFLSDKEALQKASEIANRAIEAVKGNKKATSKETGEKLSVSSMTTDSEGRTLTLDQQEFFKNSKVRDDNGNLIVMYHGTPAGGFTVFNPNYSDDNISLFFTSSMDTAASYSGSKKVLGDEDFVNQKPVETVEDAKAFFDKVKWEVIEYHNGTTRIGNDVHIAANKDVKYDVYNHNGHPVGSFYSDEELIEYADKKNTLYNQSVQKVGLYKAYLNIKKPLVVDAKRSNWNHIEFIPPEAEPVIEKHRENTKKITETIRELKVYANERGITLREAMEQSRKYAKLYDEGVDLQEELDNLLEKLGMLGDISTREIAKYAKNHGYDGVIIKNIYDTGGYDVFNEAGVADYVAIAFDSNQVKAVSNENPTSDPDIRYSVPTDSEYLKLAKDPDANKDRLQEMVEAAAQTAGYTEHVYHGTDQFGFTKFNPLKSDDHLSLFFTDDPRVASTYAGDVKGTKPISSFGKLFVYERGKKYTEAEIREAYDVINKRYHVYGEIKVNEEKQTLSHAGNRMSAKQVFEAANRIMQIGIYDVYLKPENMLEVDAKGNGWMYIPFMTKYAEEYSALQKKIEDLTKREQAIEDQYQSDYVAFAPLEPWERAPVEEVYPDLTDIRSQMADAYDRMDALDGKLTKDHVDTRELAKYASEEGYSGVIIKNLFDFGGKNTFKENHVAATIYAVFDSHAVKSADLVTYDENGEIIPLSERFKPEETDIRYSVGSRRSKKSWYNEFDSLAMRWAHSAGTYPGDVKALNRRGEEFVLIEATENGYVELMAGSAKEVYEARDRIQNEKGGSLRKDIDEVRSARVGGLWNSVHDEVTTDDDRYRGQVGGEGLQDQQTGNIEYLRTGDQGVYAEVGEDQVAIDDDIVYDDEVGSAARFSAPSWQDTDYVTKRDETIQVLVDRTGQDAEVVEKWMKDIDSVAAIIFGDYARYGYESNPLFSPLKTNSEYKYTIDFSTLCKKRKVFNATYDAIQQYFRNTVLTAEDFVRIREMLKERKYEVACGVCYVESTRKDISRITQQFIEAYREAYDGQGYLKFRGKKRYFVEEGYVPELADLNTVDGIGDIQTNHPLVWDAYLAFMNARGMQKPKLLETVSEYTDQILAKYTWRGSTSKTQAKVKTRAVDAMNRRGGLRLQSYSDFEVAQLIDMMQVVLDMATVGLKSQAYTKVPEFAALMGMTGVKINLSLIAKGDGVDENGNLIFDGVEGMDFDTAMKLRDAYSKNVGTILVGKNDAHIRAAMADPRIDFIIPYHRSSWSEALYEKLGLEGYEDYTKTQNERWEDPSAHKKGLKNLDPMAYWDFGKSGDENAQIYLDLCKKEGRVPKFPQFAGEPGYWKLLIDFKMYDNNGVGSPQEVVRPDFNMDTVREIMDAYEGTSKFEAAHDVVQDFIAEKLSDMNKSFTLNVGGSDTIYERLSLPSNGTPTMRDLIRENETQAKMIANLKQQFKLTDGKVIKPADARKIAKSLIKEYGINDVAVDEYADRISTIFTAMRREGIISEDIIDEFGYAYDLARSFATELVENATEIDTTMRDENHEILNHLRTVGILLTDDTREALREKFGSVRAGINQYWGRVKFANRYASPPDTLISELNGLGRPRFDVETSAQDAVIQILDFVEACTPTVKNPLTDYFTHQSDAIDAVTISVMEKIAGAGELVTRADRTKAAHDKKVAKLKNEMSTLKKQYREEIRAAEDRAKALGSRVSNLERWNESRKKTEVRHNIQTMWKKLATWAAKPKNRQYIPEGLFNACVKLLDTVEVTKSDFSKTAMALNELRRQYKDIETSADFSIRNVYDSEVADMIYANIELIEHSKIYNNELSLDHLKAIERVFAVVIKAVQHGRSFREIEKGGEIAAGAEEIIATQKRIRDKKANDGKFAKFIKKKTNEYLLWTESPERVFHLLDGYDPDGPFTRIFADMMRAYDYKAQIELKARDLFGNLLDGDNEGFNQFFGDKAETVKLRGYDFTFEEEHEIEVTKGMMLSLWFHLQNEQNVKHLAGGVFVPDVKQWKNGNLSGAIESREGYRFNIAELREQVYDFIYDSEYAMDFIDAAKNWFWKMSGEVINKTSLKVDGFRRADVNNYYPIATESAFNKKDIEEVLTADIIAGNKNFLIDRVKNAGNPILLTDILSVLDKQIIQVSNYAAFDAIRKDMSALMNYFRKGYDESLKNSLRKAFGTDKVEKYINELVSDLTGAKQKTDWSKTLNKFQANFARSALSMNPTTPLKQIAAYPQAAYILGWEPMLKATIQSGDVEEINKWTNLYRVREAGGLNNIMGYELPSGDRLGRFMDRHPAWFGWIEKMDLFVVRKIWAAAKEWTRINTDLDEASDEFFQRTAVMFEKAVYQTQDQHMALMSPNIQRHGNTWTRLMFPFITQPLQQAGIVYDAIGDYLANHKNAVERARAEKKLASAVSSTLASYAALSAVTMVGQILMGRASDYEDEEGNLMDFWNWLEQFGYDMIGNMSGMLLGGQDIYELVMHWLTGNRYYGMEIGSIQQVFDAYDGLVYLGDAIKTGDWQKIGDRLLKTGIDVAKAFGIPAGNIQRIAKAFTEHIDTWFLGGSYSSDRTAGQISAMIDNAVKSGDAGYMSQQRTKAADATRELLETKVQGYLNQGYTQAEARSKAGSAVKSALTSYFKPLYLEYRASGDTVSANRIQVMLTSLPLPNKYTSETFQDWWKNRDK